MDFLEATLLKCACVGTKAGNEWASCPERGTGRFLLPPFSKLSITLFYCLKDNNVGTHTQAYKTLNFSYL